MGFWTLFEVASMPILQVLLISALGAIMATEYCNLLPAITRKSLNKIVFIVFTPSLTFASLAKTVTLEDIISWWFMPVNIGLTFLFGGILGWILVKIMKPKPYLEGLVIATCSSGNLGNLLLIIVPAICNEAGSPFGGDRAACSSVGLSYASFSMALGGFYIWTYTYHLIRTSSVKFKALKATEEDLKEPNRDLDATQETHLLKAVEEDQDQEQVIGIVVASSAKSAEDTEDQSIVPQESASPLEEEQESFWSKLQGIVHMIVEELLAPPTIAAIMGFVFGAVTWLRHLIIGDTAPLRVIQDSVKILGDGTIPCITLILGGNLTQGLRSSRIRAWVIVGVVLVRYIALPAIGIWVVKGASQLGFLPSDRLFHFVLMVQFTLPPAMNIGTMTQLFDVGQEECSVLFLWTYLVAALALTVWSTIYMWILS
ncbi:auxin efflux carrier family protein [Tripterygium wilfordii]|uniref:Auxin efflux carrier family protein n=1 Tax=Tripterygium wilfordii TaxID=458696 RepID=A0A7J7CVC4_TRIWF|nr:protein PIN-LIKES 7-like [Tripterygium wilfordii]XP_038719481.1 protein PIN-LIKES 7-like [Tripterygium wilfordii]XP_038719482.1 protein PIN-LIKES 7-like [Tripterygium wilfordii]KAF5738085.1 auxin efflux carrier family protein [Tripterygium wilfordii]